MAVSWDDQQSLGEYQYMEDLSPGSYLRTVTERVDNNGPTAQATPQQPISQQFSQDHDYPALVQLASLASSAAGRLHSSYRLSQGQWNQPQISNGSQSWSTAPAEEPRFDSGMPTGPSDDADNHSPSVNTASLFRGTVRDPALAYSATTEFSNQLHHPAPIRPFLPIGQNTPSLTIGTSSVAPSHSGSATPNTSSITPVSVMTWPPTTLMPKPRAPAKTPTKPSDVADPLMCPDCSHELILRASMRTHWQKVHGMTKEAAKTRLIQTRSEVMAMKNASSSNPPDPAPESSEAVTDTPTNGCVLLGGNTTATQHSVVTNQPEASTLNPAAGTKRTWEQHHSDVPSRTETTRHVAPAHVPGHVPVAPAPGADLIQVPLGYGHALDTVNQILARLRHERREVTDEENLQLARASWNLVPLRIRGRYPEADRLLGAMVPNRAAGDSMGVAGVFNPGNSDGCPGGFVSVQHETREERVEEENGEIEDTPVKRMKTDYGEIFVPEDYVPDKRLAKVYRDNAEASVPREEGEGVRKFRIEVIPRAVRKSKEAVLKNVEVHDDPRTDKNGDSAMYDDGQASDGDSEAETQIL